VASLCRRPLAEDTAAWRHVSDPFGPPQALTILVPVGLAHPAAVDMLMLMVMVVGCLNRRRRSLVTAPSDLPKVTYMAVSIS